MISTAHVNWIEETLRDALSYAPIDWLDVRIFVTQGEKTSSTPDLVEELLGRWDRQPASADILHIQLDRRETRSPAASLSRSSTTGAGENLSLHTTNSNLSATSGTVTRSQTRTTVASGEGALSFATALSAHEALSEFSTLQAGQSTTSLFEGGSCGASTGTSWSTLSHDGKQVTLPLHAGRPDVRQILQEIIGDSDYSDSVTVGTCGPVGLTRDVADAVSQAIDPKKVYKGEHRRNIVSPLACLRTFPDVLFSEGSACRNIWVVMQLFCAQSTRILDGGGCRA